MALPEYENLNQDELEWADHYAEIGDMTALRRLQETSASRGDKSINEVTYNNPMIPRRKT